MAYKPYIKKANGEIQEIPIVATKLGESNLGSSDTPVYLDQGTAKVCSKTLKDNSQIVNLIYPVGSIYMSVNSTSPQTIFGGTWEQLKDRFLIGAGNLYSGGNTGGETSHTLTISEMPSHSHNTDSRVMGWDAGSGNIKNPGSGDRMYSNTWGTSSTGGGQAHNNMPPYLAVYIWKRTA